MSTPQTCPRCAAPLDPGAVTGGLCPQCLLRESLGLSGSVVLGEAEAHPLRPAPALEELAPHFPELELESLIARGGMGAVYRAQQKNLGRTVALKVLDPEIAARPGFAERFAREARALAQLAHPNIVTIHEHGQRGTWCFLLMEFVDGASLRQMIRARGAASREALAIVAQVCDALQYAHDQGVVHRDIKPENILVDRRGRVKILDFGLAKLVGRETPALTRSSQVMGTPHYMAPEQWEKPLEVDHRADIYSLGVVFYELLTGELPVGRFAPPSSRVQLDVRLDGVVLRTLEREPELRYQQASEVKTDVERIQGGAPVPPPVPKPPPQVAATRAPVVLQRGPANNPTNFWYGVPAIVVVIAVLHLILGLAGILLWLVFQWRGLNTFTYSVF